MTRLRADQLPASVRKKHGLNTKGGRSKPSRAGTSDNVPCPGHCACGEPFPTARAWEHHADTTGHTRWAIDLEQTP
jgi:hypothetical protein